LPLSGFAGSRTAAGAAALGGAPRGVTITVFVWLCPSHPAALPTTSTAAPPRTAATIDTAASEAGRMARHCSGGPARRRFHVKTV
jgi:hypothetical protein